MVFAPRHPPLACRPSPPPGGRSDVTSAFANRNSRRIEARVKLPISPLVGEMAGRPEGGGRELDLSHIPSFSARR
ncbi:MAG: hypothetical protein EOS14_15045 [Mesorhizobium sp.]|nr:MAG: hypothetical protein EOS14_15045 [Mesorhizobium sp.]